MSGCAALVTTVGEASGSKAAAAVLACAGSEPDRAGLLVDVGGPPPRPALVATEAARELERRLARHLPDAPVAARGQTCHLALAGDPTAFDGIRAALPLVRESIAAVHVPPGLVQAAVAEVGPELAAALLRADLCRDRALTALAVADLIAAGSLVRVLKRPVAWVPARRALFGVLPSTAAGELLPGRLAGLLDISSKPCSKPS